MSAWNDPEAVRRQYATEERLEARASVYDRAPGVDANDRLIALLADRRPARLLEVGCGPGRLAQRLRQQHGLTVTAVDQSPRMVELARGRGVDATVGDIQALPFSDGSFDCVVAAWMLYHVADLDRGLREVVRVLAPGGALLAVTNSEKHLGELWELAGLERYPLPFSAENGAAILNRHFAAVTHEDVSAPVTFPDHDAVRRYVLSSISGRHLADRLPVTAGPLTATRRCRIFTAVTPSAR